MAMDIANYINETMMDNAHPADNGIAIYLNNCMTEEEIDTMAKIYLK